MLSVVTSLKITNLQEVITIFTERVTRSVFVELYTKSVIYIKNVKNVGKNEAGNSLIVATETGTYLFPLGDIRNWWIKSEVLNINEDYKA